MTCSMIYPWLIASNLVAWVLYICVVALICRVTGRYLSYERRSLKKMVVFWLPLAAGYILILEVAIRTHLYLCH